MNLSFLSSRVSLKEKSIFARNLGIMLSSGLDISEALAIISSQSTGSMKNVINRISEHILAGNTLANGLSLFPKIFSSFFIASVAAGEASGNLEINLKNAAEQMTKEEELNKKIKSAMIYPAIIIIIGLAVAFGVSFLVLPKITPIFISLKTDLPLSTKILIKFSGFIKDYGVVFLTSLVAVFFILNWILRREFIKPGTHFLLLRLPIVKALSVNKNMASFCRNMGLLLSSGLPIDDCLRVAADTVANYKYKRIISHLREEISQGEKLSDCLEKYGNYFPPMAVGMIRVGEKSGNLDGQFMNLAAFYQAEIDNAVKNLTAILEPALLVIIGLVVGALALAIITPIYKITGDVYR